MPCPNQVKLRWGPVQRVLRRTHLGRGRDGCGRLLGGDITSSAAAISALLSAPEAQNVSKFSCCVSAQN